MTKRKSIENYLEKRSSTSHHQSCKKAPVDVAQSNRTNFKSEWQGVKEQYGANENLWPGRLRVIDDDNACAPTATRPTRCEAAIRLPVRRVPSLSSASLAKLHHSQRTKVPRDNVLALRCARESPMINRRWFLVRFAATKKVPPTPPPPQPVPQPRILTSKSIQAPRFFEVKLGDRFVLIIRCFDIALGAAPSTSAMMRGRGTIVFIAR